MSSSMQEDASRAFFEQRYGQWSAQEQAALAQRLTAEPTFAKAYQGVEQSWDALDGHAQAPEIVALREEALAHVRYTGMRRCGLRREVSRGRLAAAVGTLALLFAAAWQLSPYGFKPGQYETRVGELRMLELEDRSRIAIDSATRLAVQYTEDARTVRLLEGQAQFSVAHDPARPFKVQVGDRTIVALGTVFTVEYANEELHVAMLEGKVAVMPASTGWDLVPERRATGKTPAQGQSVELAAGEALKLARDGELTLTAQADLEAATAWREGKVILRTEPLEDAVRKMNRYSTVKIEIHDPSLAEERISGVFEAGNSLGFINDLERVLAIDARHVDAETIELRRR